MIRAHPPPPFELGSGESNSAIWRATLTDAPETSMRAPTGRAAKRGEACPRSVEDAVGVGESTRVHRGERGWRGGGGDVAVVGVRTVEDGGRA